MRKLVALALAALLAACGQKAKLEPLAGQPLPAVPYGAAVRPDAEKLLELDTIAAPERSVELRKKSEERADDPFDLPPE
jgi:hypothetical protein